MRNVVWNKESYKEFIEYLYSLQDLKYRDFHSGLGVNKDYLIGIRTPELKKIAKEISLGDYQSFINFNTHNTYEERLIHGFVIGYIKEDFKTTQQLLLDFMPYIDNWAICDLVCSNTKIWAKYTREGLNFINMALKSKNIWYNRTGFVLLLNYYLNDEYIDTVLDLCSNYKTDEYYVIMAIAWTISICYIKYPSKTIIVLKNKKLSKEIQNKAIQKIRESNRVNDKEKENLKSLRI